MVFSKKRDASHDIPSAQEARTLADINLQRRLKYSQEEYERALRDTRHGIQQAIAMGRVETCEYFWETPEWIVQAVMNELKNAGYVVKLTDRGTHNNSILRDWYIDICWRGA